MAGERKLIRDLVTQMLLKEYLQKEVQRSGFGGMKIQRGPMSTNISMEIQRPGLVIGRKGSAISNLTARISDKFGMENPQIEIQDINNPSLNSNLMAYQLTKMLRRGWNHRRAAYTIVTRIMEAGAKGCEVIISGKLTSQRHRTLKITKGYIKHSGEAAKEVMSKGYAEAKLKPGVVGVVVSIMKSDVLLPDKIKEKAPVKEIEKEVEAPQVEEAPGKGAKEAKEPKETKKGKPAKEPKETKKGKPAKEPKEVSLEEISQLSPPVIKKLSVANINTLAELKGLTIDDLMSIRGIGKKTAESIISVVKNAKKRKR